MKALLLLVLSWSVPAFAQSKTVVGYFSREPESVFQQKAKPAFERFLGTDCKDCELRNLTPYDAKGLYKASGLLEAVNGIPADVSFLFFDWNERFSPAQQSLVDALSAQVAKGRLLISPAGVPSGNEGSCPLTKTLMGKVDDSLILGELLERDRLLPQCYFGPEMLTALRPPKDLIGQGLAPLQFAAGLAAHWKKRDGGSAWLAHFTSRKANTKKLWLELEDFFPR